MPYEEEKNIIQACVGATVQNWTHKSFDNLGIVFGHSTDERQLEQLLSSLGINRQSMWQACFVEGKFVVVFAEGDTLSVYSQLHGQTKQEKLNFQAHSISICQGFDVVQIFVGSASGSLRHLFFDAETNELSSSFQTIVDNLQQVVPCTFDPVCHQPHYFWTIGEKSIKFHAVIDSTVHTSVIFKLSANPGKLISAQNIVDMRDNSSGIAIYFIAENGSDLCSLVLDAVPAILYTQQKFQNTRKACIVNNVTLLRSPIRSEGGMVANLIRRQQADSISFLVTSHAAHDYEIDYKDVEMALQNSHMNFTWTAHTVNTNGVINKVQYFTKQHELRQALESYGESLLSSAASQNDFDSLKVVYNYKLEVHSFFGQAYESKSVNHPQPTDYVSIFTACVDCRLSLVSRKELVFNVLDKNDGFWRRVVIIEALVALQLSDIVGRAIEKRDSGAFNENYFVADVQRLFDWVAGTSTSSLCLFIVKNLKSTLDGKTVPLLSKRQFSANYERNQSMELLLLHQELVTASVALCTITKSLLERKKAIIDLSPIHHKDLTQIPLTHDLVFQSLVELFLLNQESEALRKVCSLVVQMLKDEAITLSIFGQSSSCRNMTIAKDSLKSRTCLQDNMKGVLPQYLMTENLLFDLFAEHLSSESLPSTRYYEWDLEVVHERVSDLLMLPYHVVHQRCTDLTLGKRGYVKKTLQQLGDDLMVEYLKALKIVVYVLLDCNNTSNVLAEKVVEMNVDCISTILDIDLESIQYIQSAQFIDSGTQLDSAIEKFCYSTGITYLEMNNFILPVIQRLLSSGHQHIAYKFIRALAVRDHRILSTKEGAVAVALAQPDNDPLAWKSTWHSAKKCVANVKPQVEALQASIDITHFITIWTIRQGVLVELLNGALDYGEIETIIGTLMKYAEIDLKECRSPSPTVDILFAFLLKNYRIEDARKLHEDHSNAVATRADIRIDESIKDREALLRGIAAIDVPSMLDHNMRLNLTRVKTFFH